MSERNLRNLRNRVFDKNPVSRFANELAQLETEIQPGMTELREMIA